MLRHTAICRSLPMSALDEPTNFGAQTFKLFRLIEQFRHVWGEADPQ